VNVCVRAGVLQSIDGWQYIKPQSRSRDASKINRKSGFAACSSALTGEITYAVEECFGIWLEKEAVLVGF
jgi:hypothetical protein